jgi:Mrp family chromosome partitioning ATPase/capsular polysaccharide biosynthesis protein
MSCGDPGGSVDEERKGERSTTLRDYLDVVRRRRWIILPVVVLVPLAAVAFSLQQTRLYQESAQVLLSSQNLASQLTGTQQTGIQQDPVRIAQTQADVARVPAVAQSVFRRVSGTGLTVQAFLSDSSVSAAADADILTFDVTNHDPNIARRLADAYASAYTDYRRELDTASIVRALAGVNLRIKELAHGGAARSALYTSLVGRQETLATMEALQTSNASVVKTADHATQIQPKPTRNGILGLALGIVLGIGLAFLWEALDTRVRTAQEIGQRLGGLPLLARIPAPRRKRGVEQGLAMLANPSGAQAETFRMLRTNLEFVTLGRNDRTVMVTSAIEQEGKSTTIANLGVALARAGRRVVLVDLDLRRPSLDKLFDLTGPGLTQVALGHVSLYQALARIAITDPHPAHPSGANGSGNGNGNGNGHGETRVLKGILEVLPSGPIPPDPGEFVGNQAVAAVLEQLRFHADVVLIDAPPLLRVGDAMTLSQKVDGVIVVASMRTARRQVLDELARQLETSSARVLGFVVTGAGEDGAYSGYGYAEYGYAQPVASPDERTATVGTSPSFLQPGTGGTEA